MSPRQRLKTLSSEDADGSPPSASRSPAVPKPLVVSSSSSLSSSSEEEATAQSSLQQKASPSSASAGAIPPTSSSSSESNGGVDIRERDRHDIFNLLALPFVLLAVVANWDIPKWILQGATLQDSWHDTYIYELIGTVMLYFMVDLVWVSFVPSCVKSPGTIVKHHIVALIYVWAPVFYPEYRCYVGAILAVELNTWFLILRRVLFLRKDSPYATKQVRDLVDYAFYVTWIVIRVVGYNAILVALIPLLILRFQLQQTVLFPTMFVMTQLILNLMNLKWTFDLFMPIIQRQFTSLAGAFSSNSYNGIKGGNDEDNGNREHTL